MAEFPVTLIRDLNEITIQVSQDEYIWDAARQAGIDLPASCLQGWCVTCAGKLLSGQIDQSDALRYFDADREAGFVLLCTAKPRSPCRILTHQKEACREHRQNSGLPTPLG